MAWVTVGNPGNAADTEVMSTDGTTGYGGVDYAYRIGKYEVTTDQYTEFLNAVAATDANGLYAAYIISTRNGITRNGWSGSYRYSAKPHMGNKPVNFVSWYDALRFANWLHNGQPAGEQDASTTEDGVYDMSLGASVVRKPGARVWLPSEDEWYKAAYYEPAASGNDYWTYGTRSDDVPTVATANSVGDISNPAANVANYNFGADWNGQDGNLTSVGSAGSFSESYYGAADMTGNVWEWNETLVGSSRGLRGGSWDDSYPYYLQSSFRSYFEPTHEYCFLGFRVAAIPEPGTATLSIAGLLCLLCWRRRRGGFLVTKR